MTYYKDNAQHPDKTYLESNHPCAESWNSGRLSEVMRLMAAGKIKAIRLHRNDREGRPLAKCENGKIYCNVNLIYGSEDWHATTENGEPTYPVKLHFVVNLSDIAYP